MLTCARVCMSPHVERTCARILGRYPGSFLLGTGAEDYPESAYVKDSVTTKAVVVSTTRHMILW